MKSNGPSSPSVTPKSDPAAARRAAASKALVEAAARGALREVNPPPDLMLAGFPFTPALWMIVVEPLQPREYSDGGVAVVDLSQDAESYQMTVGRVLKAGPASFDGQTTGGVKLSNFTDDIQRREDLIGKYVVYQLHVGQELTLRKTGQIVKAMKLTDCLGVTEDPAAWKFYI
jgi:hypothetical protein